jgi:pimeloyl-ACP methyl ester carboxylesterase
MRADFPHVDGVSHRFVDAAGLRVHVAEAGPEGGDPVVCLHGWPQHWYEWRRLIAPLAAAGKRVICPDLRGLGWTEAPRKGYEKGQLASDVLAAMDSLGIERAKLVGHDWGGWVGFLICLGHPERVDRFLALNIAPPFVAPRAVKVRAVLRFYYQWLLATPLLGKRVAARLGRMPERMYERNGMGTGVWTLEERAIFLDYLAEPEHAWATVQYYRSFQLRETWPLIRGRYRTARLAVPTLLLFGKEDKAIDWRMLDGVERGGDDFRVELVEGCGHFIADERPELVEQRALEFLA